MFLEYCEQNNIKKVKFYLFLNNMFLEYCEQNNIEKVKFYLELGANVNYKCKFKKSALKYAVKNNSEELLDLLLSQPGVDVNVTSGRNRFTALTYACEQDRVNIVKRLCQVSEINPNIKTKFDDSALLIAIYDNNIECVKILRTVIKTDWNIRNGARGGYPIIISLIHGRIDIFEIILSVTELDLSVTDDIGRNIVQIAIQHRNNEVSQRAVEILSRDKRVNCWNDKDKYGNTPLMYCLKSDKKELVQSLINTSAVDLNTEDRNGKYPEEILYGWKKDTYALFCSFQGPRVRIIRRTFLFSRKIGYMMSLQSLSGVVVLESLISNNYQERNNFNSLVDMLSEEDITKPCRKEMKQNNLFF